ncbi:hypothetical protein [Natribacillus halophilus]|uniref:Uncharacterized protein n=1 Tax=Natribacillus halophilus TaxID=549003 RepID=A0A1G8J825_9BACI|nr:hypothetical protein [Natribacillus halophilus]SDI27252.1 hypothetical protein SAMN04488123_10178 [Natribacillus halophilus]
MRFIKGLLVMLSLILVLVGCGSENAEDLGADLERMEYEEGPGIEPNELYVRHQQAEGNYDDLKDYSDYYSTFLEHYHDELEVLYDHVDDDDEAETKASVERLSALVEDITDRPTPPEFHDLRDVTLGSLLEMDAIAMNVSDCADGDAAACDLTRSYTENLTEYLRTMEYTYDQKIAEFGLVD